MSNIKEISIFRFGPKLLSISESIAIIFADSDNNEMRYHEPTPIQAIGMDSTEIIQEKSTIMINISRQPQKIKDDMKLWLQLALEAKEEADCPDKKSPWAKRVKHFTNTVMISFTFVLKGDIDIPYRFINAIPTDFENDILTIYGFGYDEGE
jgi:hypothetical protein